MRIACLPWYDIVETHESTDRLWGYVASGLRATGLSEVPARLDRRAQYRSQWQEDGLLLGQACGYDVCCANDHNLQIVGVPRYGMAGCEGTKYRSFVIVREDSKYDSLDDLRGTHCVINSPRSHSGMNVLQALVAPLAESGKFFGGVSISGAHEKSLDMIASKVADVAAIDCITYGLLERHRSEALASTRVIYRTGVLPSPPYVTSAQTPPELVVSLRLAIGRAIGRLDIPDREALGLLGIEAAKLSDYRGIAELHEGAQRSQYFELAGES